MRQSGNSKESSSDNPMDDVKAVYLVSRSVAVTVEYLASEKVVHSEQ